MKLTVLIDNVAGGKLLAEHGLSYLIEHDEKAVLFDTGHSMAFLKNAFSLGIDIPSDIDTVVLSHGHWDHGDGLRYIHNKTLITHPSAFIKRYRRNTDVSIGLSLTKEEVEKKFRLIETADPYFITEKIIFLGGIPRLNSFESKQTTFVDENGNDDFVPDDSALVLINDNALIIVAGCSHAGICNIIEYAKKITGIGKIKAVIGGFHLKGKDEQT